MAKLGYEDKGTLAISQNNPGDGKYGAGDESSNVGSAPVGKQTTVLELASGAADGYGICTAEGPEGGDLTLGTDHAVLDFARNFS